MSRATRAVRGGEYRTKKTKLEHHDWKKPEQNEHGGFPIRRTFARERIDRHPSGNAVARRVSCSCSMKALDSCSRLLRSGAFIHASSWGALLKRMMVVQHASLLVGRLEKRATVTRVTGLRRLNARRPLAIGVLHARLDSRKDNFCDVASRLHARFADLRDFAEVAAFEKRNPFRNDLRRVPWIAARP